MITPTNLDVEETLSVLPSLLAVQGYATVQQGCTIKIVPTRVGADPDSIKPKDTIVTQVMPLTAADATEIAEQLADLVLPYGVMVAHAHSNTLIVTATSAAVRHLAEIIEHLDVSTSDLVRVEVFSLQHADAEALAEVINELYETPADTERREQQERVERRGRFPGGFRGDPFGQDQATVPGEQTKRACYVAWSR